MALVHNNGFMNLRRCLALALLCGCSTTVPPSPVSHDTALYFYAWAGDLNQEDSDFLAVIDVARGSRSYGEVVHTVPVGMGPVLPGS